MHSEQTAGGGQQHFDLVIIGGGSGNTLIGPELAHLSIALLDDGEWFGGTCLNAGCIPTKMFVRVADIAAEAQDADRLGLDARIAPVDWAGIRDRVFARTDKLSRAGFRNRDEKQPNVTVFRETFGFESPHELVSASGARIRGERIVVAAGSRPRPLLAAYEPDAALHDSDSIMRIEHLPASLAIVGGGTVAAEFAHIFSSLGVNVTQIARGERLLGALDPGVSETFTRLATERWTVITGAQVEEIERSGSELELSLTTGSSVRAEAVLVATGRIPRTDTLAAASVDFDLEPDGRLVVDGSQRVLSGGEPVDGVFALGDVSSAWQLKHVANHEARVVQHNLLHPDDLAGGNPGPVPAAIFSHPQIAYFGISTGDASETAVTVRREYRSTAFGWAEEDTTSFCSLVVDRESGLILGAHILGPQASILIQPLVMAASLRLSVRGLARSQFWPHPAASEVVENALLDAESLIEKDTNA